MRISEFIEQLQSLKQELGDVHVLNCVDGPSGYCAASLEKIDDEDLRYCDEDTVTFVKSHGGVRIGWGDSLT